MISINSPSDVPALKDVNALKVFVPPNVCVPERPARVVVKSGNVIVEFASADCHSWENPDAS
jgi:hypothetical protein